MLPTIHIAFASIFNEFGNRTWAPHKICVLFWLFKPFLDQRPIRALCVLSVFVATNLISYNPISKKCLSCHLIWQIALWFGSCICRLCIVNHVIQSGKLLCGMDHAFHRVCSVCPRAGSYLWHVRKNEERKRHCSSNIETITLVGFEFVVIHFAQLGVCG